MEKLIAITQNEDGSFYSALVVNEKGYTDGYDLFMFNGDTAKHRSGDGYCGLEHKTNTIKVPFNSLEQNTIWINEDYDFIIDEKSSDECVAPKIIRGEQTISQNDWDYMCEGNLYFNEIDYHIENDNGEFIEDEDVFEEFVKRIDALDIKYEEVLYNGNLITIKYLRNESGKSFQDDKIASVIEAFETTTDFEVTVSYNNDY